MSCPSCGAPLPTHNPGIVVSVCGYCGTALSWDQDAVRDTGKKSRLPQGFTRLYTGATGSHKGQSFVVLGRVRYGTKDGAFWDEWCCLADGQDELWVTEDDHELAVEQASGRVSVPRELRPGQRVEVLGKAFIIEEVGTATCIGIEGQLPKDILPGEQYAYADGSSPDGKLSLGVEWDEAVPAVFVGRWSNDDTLALDDEGVQW